MTTNCRFDGHEGKHKPGVLRVTADARGTTETVFTVHVCVDCLSDLCDGLREDGCYVNIRVTALGSKEYVAHRR